MDKATTKVSPVDKKVNVDKEVNQFQDQYTSKYGKDHFLFVFDEIFNQFKLDFTAGDDGDEWTIPSDDYRHLMLLLNGYLSIGVDGE